jgi:hypothetical protein
LQNEKTPVERFADFPILDIRGILGRLTIFTQIIQAAKKLSINRWEKKTMAKINISKMTDAEIDRLLTRLRYGSVEGIPKAEAKKVKLKIRTLDEERVLAGLMSLRDYNRRWPLAIEGRSAADITQMEADRVARLTPKVVTA